MNARRFGGGWSVPAFLISMLAASGWAQPGGSTSAVAVTVPVIHGGPHDFDFEFGEWRTHLRRMTNPLSGSPNWVELNGTSVVRKVWGGRANLGELDIANAESHIQGLSLRTYNPETTQWNVSWVNAKDGAVTPPMVGGFKNGRGEFYNQDTFRGKPIVVRFLFTGVTASTFQLEQAFSADGGKTWEANWIASFEREKPVKGK